MSKYEWERGTIKLPSGVAPKMRRALVAAQQQYFDDVYAEAKKFWAANKTTSNKKLYEAVWAERDRCERRSRWGVTLSSSMSKAKKQALQIFGDMSQMHRWKPDAKPHAPKKEDVAQMVGERANSRATRFVTEDATITFNGNNVTWSVEENNHAIDRARDSILGKVFFKELDKVQWTRGSGGEIVGNDEYNREADYVGGGGNYQTGGYGPLGDQFWKAKQAKKRAAQRAGGTHHVRSATVTNTGVARKQTVAKNPTRKSH
jgi:hypothetical protein